MFSTSRTPFSKLRGLRVPKLRSAKGLALVTLVAACATGAVTGSASAIAFGPNLHGTGAGFIACDQVRHQLTFVYQATPDTQVYMGQNSSAINSTGTSQLVVVPEWIEVVSYVKPASGGSWVVMKDDVVLLNRAGTSYVTNLTVFSGQGRYWQAGFMVRVANPGGQWSGWYWEPATPYMSLSGILSASYGFCLT